MKRVACFIVFLFMCAGPSMADQAASSVAELRPDDRKTVDEHLLTVFTGLLVFVGAIQSFILIAHALSFRSSEDTKRKQLRAYLTPASGAAIYQDANLRFEGKPSIINMGETPAYKVRWSARAEILPAPLPADFRFPDLAVPDGEGIALGPKQSNFISAVVPARVHDAEVDNIRSGNQRALYVWAEIRYEDVFGVPHTTKLAQMLTFSADNNTIFVRYPNQHNSGD